MITQKELKEILDYNPDTGILTYLISPANHVKVGDVAGSLGKHGYLAIMIKGKKYLAHRLAFLFMNELLPKQVDYINHVRNDNRWINLRSVNNKVNHRNQTMKNTNTSGFVGVTFNKNSGKWLAQIKVDYKNIYLGIYKDINEAIKIRKQANIMYGFHENHGLSNV